MGITLALALLGILTVGLVDLFDTGLHSGGTVIVSTLPPSKPKAWPAAERRRPASEPLQLRTSML